MSLIPLNEDANCFKNPNSFMVDPVNVGQALSVSRRGCGLAAEAASIGRDRVVTGLRIAEGRSRKLPVSRACEPPISRAR